MTTHMLNDLAVEIDGQGDALLCIHGLGGSSNTWTPLLPVLAGFKVIRPDLPGSGRSSLPAQALSIELTRSAESVAREKSKPLVESLLKLVACLALFR